MPEFAIWLSNLEAAAHETREDTDGASAEAGDGRREGYGADGYGPEPRDAGIVVIAEDG